MSDSQYTGLIIVLVVIAWGVINVGGNAIDELIRIRKLLEQK